MTDAVGNPLLGFWYVPGQLCPGGRIEEKGIRHYKQVAFGELAILDYVNETVEEQKITRERCFKRPMVPKCEWILWTSEEKAILFRLTYQSLVDQSFQQIIASFLIQ